MLLLLLPLFQVGILRRGRYLKGKQVGKGDMVQPGDQVSTELPASRPLVIVQLD